MKSSMSYEIRNNIYIYETEFNYLKINYLGSY